jgi:hypothetical protein
MNIAANYFVKTLNGLITDLVDTDTKSE